MSDKPLPPKLASRSPLGHLSALRRDALQLFSRAVAEHGDIVRLRVAAQWVVVVRNPAYVKYVLQDQQRYFSKQTRGYGVLRRLLGNGLVTSEGDFWLRQRRISQPGFHRQRVAHFAATMTELTSDLLSRWQAQPEGASVDVAEEMMALTMRIVGKTLLGTEVGPEAGVVGPALGEVLHQVIERTTQLLDLPSWVPTARNVRERNARAALDSVVFRIIEERRRTGEVKPDLLSMLMEARDEETGEGMTDLQLRDEVMTLFLAGHETTANALTWALYLLAKNPHALEALEAELRSVLDGKTPTFEDLPRLVYTQAVASEAMRLYPPVWMLVRRAERDEELGGFRIPAKSFVACSQWLSHRDPVYFPEPEKFDPQRFLEKRAEALPRFAYFPFSGGPRVCIGNAFALMEMQLILAMVAQRFRMRLVPGHPVVLDPTVTLRPRHGMRMLLERREGPVDETAPSRVA